MTWTASMISPKEGYKMFQLLVLIAFVILGIGIAWGVRDFLREPDGIPREGVLKIVGAIVGFIWNLNGITEDSTNP